MRKGPKGERRPADVIGNAVKVMRIATGEIPEQLETRSGITVLRYYGITYYGDTPVFALLPRRLRHRPWACVPACGV